MSLQCRTSFSAAVSGRGARAGAAEDEYVDDMEGSTNPIEKESRGKDENSVAKKRKLLAFYSLWYQLSQVFWN
jgi:hypothetical protein